MIDLEINNSGDLVLDDNKIFPQLRLDFVVSKFPTARVRFLQGNESSSAKATSGGALIRFHIETAKGSDGKTAATLSERDALRQLVEVRLRTERGDIVTNSDFGSKIAYVKHEDINSKTTQDELKAIVLDEIADILEDPTVVVKPEQCEGTFYCQNINIYIFDGGKLLYKFSLLE